MRRIQKIAFVTGSMAAGGAERVIATLSNAFACSGIEVIIYCIGKTSQDAAYEYNPKVKIIGIHSGSHCYIIRKITQLSCLRSMIKSFMPDSIIAFQDYINIQTIIACYGLGIPITISVRTYPVIASTFIKMSTRFFYKFANAAVFQTSEQQNFYKACKKRKDITILNPFDTSKVSVTGTISKNNQIVAVGRLTYAKNFQLLLRAFHLISKDYPELKLIIIGEGEKRSELEHIRAELGLEQRICISGVKANVFDYIAGARIFVMTSLYEGLPNALIEALCLGVPCISTRFSGGGAETLIQDCENGLLVTNDNCEALADAMRHLLSNNELAHYISENAKTIIKRVDSHKIMSEWLDLLEGLL